MPVYARREALGIFAGSIRPGPPDHQPERELYDMRNDPREVELGGLKKEAGDSPA